MRSAKFSTYILTGVVLLLFTIPGIALAQPVYSATPKPAYISLHLTPQPEQLPRSNKNYLQKLFDFGSASTSPNPDMSLVEWLIAIPATLFYGEIAILLLLWILFSSDVVGIIAGLIIIGLIIAFSRARRTRPLALFVLALLNFFLGASITIQLAFAEGVPFVLISILPAAGLVWLAFPWKKVIFSKSRGKSW